MRYALLLPLLATAGCGYIVADSIDNCRYESESVGGWRVWSSIRCVEDKEREPARPTLP